MNKEFFDVVVIGAGPSGAVASTLLAKRGYKVLVIENSIFHASLLVKVYYHNLWSF